MWLAAAAVGLAAIAFVVTFSRSSVAGLLLGALVLEMAWLGRRKGSIAALVTVLVLAVGLVGITELRGPHHLHIKLDTIRRINKLTGGRDFLVKPACACSNVTRSPASGSAAFRWPSLTTARRTPRPSACATATRPSSRSPPSRG